MCTLRQFHLAKMRAKGRNGGRSGPSVDRTHIQNDKCRLAKLKLPVSEVQAVLAQHSGNDHIDFPGFLGLWCTLVQRMNAKLEEAVSVLFTKPQRRCTAATQRLCRCTL